MSVKPMSVKTVKEYPEHVRLHAVKKESQCLGQFLEWLGWEGATIARYHTHTDHCYEDGDEEGGGNLVCGYDDETLYPDHIGIEARLAAYFNIDLDKLEDEKRSMLGKLAKLAKA